jgi:hypothetical protein
MRLVMRSWPVLLALSACGGESAAPVSFADYCDRYAQVTCDFARRCDCLHGATIEMCRAVMGNECATDVETPVNDGRQAYDAEQGGACLAGLQSVLGSCTPDYDAYPDACDRMLVGLLGEGRSCDGSDECVPGLDCYNGRCIDPPAAGEACVDGSYCPGSMFCGADELCHAPRGAGQPCPEGDQACADEMFCDNRTTTCEPLLHSGAPCMDFGGVCADGLYCSLASGNCTPIPGNGGDCGDSSGECASGLYCDAAGRVCRPQLPAGQPCTDGDQCLSGDCTGDVCAAPSSDSCPF